MSRTGTHEITSYLLQHGVSLPMVAILEAQRINEDDLQTMDRDDVEHLFKNDYGFTFADRKRLWAAVQTLRLDNKKAATLFVEQQDEPPDIYEIIDNQLSDYQSTSRQYVVLSTSSSSGLRTASSAPIYHDSSSETSEDVCEEMSSDGTADTLRRATTSLPAGELPAEHQPSKVTAKVTFEYPVQLPVFSSKVVQALQNNTIETEWRTLIKELVQWILSVTLALPRKCEYQAIGHTLFRQYPGIGRDGFRPWSYLCKCLTESLRKERYRRGLPRVRKIN